MKTTLFIVLFLLVAVVRTQAQDKEQKKGDVFMVVEQMPEYPGGFDGLKSYIMENVKYPEQAKKNKVEGKVFVSFVIDKDGSVTDAKVVRAVDPTLDTEALRVVNDMEKWTPGKQKGETVKVQYTLPIQFALD